MKRLLKVTAMTGLLTLTKMAMGFVIAKVVAMYTGPTGIAMLGQVQSMVTSFTGLTNAPASSGVVRYTAENCEHGYAVCSPWWKASLQWIIIISSIIIPLGLLFSEELSNWLLHDPKLSWVVVVTVCLLPLSAIGTLCNSVINGLQQYRRYIALGMLSAITSSGIMLIMVTKYSVQGALLASASQSALVGLVMLVMNIKQPWLKLSLWWGKVEHKPRKAIRSYMLMAITSALTVPVSIMIVRGILADKVGWDITGQWQAVWKISEVYLGVITMALGTYYLPRLASIKGVDNTIREINRTVVVILPIVTVLAVIIYFMRDLIILLLFTSDFSGARDLFAIQLTGDVIKIISWLYAYPMLSHGATRLYISSEIIFSINFVVIGFFFIDYYGVDGANLSYLINYTLYLLFVTFNVRRFISYK
ncbi:TPA: O-antigen translocase [Vibrio parahaemolyticus]|uniref:O-antigen translocase n=3 Tax=Vibrio parahaemolyticus TaxID=670 RepID=UPI000A3A308E|nr:O-antigen translocase [Vibrio parahaemolyticus]EJG0326644.1 O-antigen translocase [Vibrio parahaemolyticus]OUJ53920.1 hypothetical protein BTO03_23940 [Vibrio parahaemolyticus]HCH3679737.1 O-antigen translocase [Vibrio parahaemolyticus]